MIVGVLDMERIFFDKVVLDVAGVLGGERS